jgi:DoxX-like family
MSTASTHSQPSQLETSAEIRAITSKAQLWTGRVLSVLSILFLLFDAVGKFARPVPVVDAFARLGIPISLSTSVGILLLACTILYAFPRTAVLGAVLLTGYLGGAVAIHMRAGSTAFETAFPVIFGVLAWSGLYLRSCSLRKIFPVFR